MRYKTLIVVVPSHNSLTSCHDFEKLLNYSHCYLNFVINSNFGLKDSFLKDQLEGLKTAFDIRWADNRQLKIGSSQ